MSARKTGAGRGNVEAKKSNRASAEPRAHETRSQLKAKKTERASLAKARAEALAKATGQDRDAIKKLYKQRGDYGIVAEELLPAEAKKLTVRQVYDRLMTIATTSGEGTVEKKTNLLSELLSKVTGGEARYVLRIPLGRLRLGIGDPTVMEGLSWSKTGDKTLRPQIERAYNVCSDLGQVAHVFKGNGVDALAKIQVQVGNPVRMALAFAQAIEAGRHAFEAGLMEMRDMASPSTPQAGLAFRD